MSVDPQLLEILACPCDQHAPLQPAARPDGGPGLACTGCARVFPVVDGIPVLLLDEAVTG
ncbi:MAG: Trm112 family protein [Pseudonocardiales bacterium]|nr:Trm112 family protein [Pseudonocardiales bacterium]